MSGVWNKVTNMFFPEEEEENENLNQQEMDTLSAAAPKDVWQENDVKKARRNQIMAIPGNATPKKDKACEMVLVKAKAYEDLENIAMNIREQKVVIVNFEEIDKETAQRMVDFLSGAVFALDGKTKKVSGSTFLFSSSQVDLAGQIMESEAQALGGNAASDAAAAGGFGLWRR